MPFSILQFTINKATIVASVMPRAWAKVLAGRRNSCNQYCFQFPWSALGPSSQVDTGNTFIEIPLCSLISPESIGKIFKMSSIIYFPSNDLATPQHALYYVYVAQVHDFKRQTCNCKSHASKQTDAYGKRKFAIALLPVGASPVLAQARTDLNVSCSNSCFACVPAYMHVCVQY